MITAWHKNEPLMKDISESDKLTTFIVSNNMCNYKLWHEEDFARRTDVKDSEIAQVKRNIDGWNQKRNDFIEKIDEEYISGFQSSLTMEPGTRQHSETIGSIIDKLSIINLKVFHMKELVETYPDRSQYSDKLNTLGLQRIDLARCLQELHEDIADGRRFINIYRQMKMYNDPEMNAQLNKDLK